MDMNFKPIKHLSGGAYVVTVTDGNNCELIDSILVNEPADLIASIVDSSSVLCFNAADGFVVMAVTGGVFPYAYNWATGQTDSTINALTGGVYNLTVTDANLCTTSSSITLTEPSDPITLAFSVAPPSCVGSSDACAIANVTFNNGNLGFLWSTGQTLDSICGLSAGNYSITVTDTIVINGNTTVCSANASIPVLDPSPVVITIDSTINASCNAGNDGGIFISVSGGTGGYTYAWSNAETTEDITGLIAGTYFLTVSDGNLCTVLDTINVLTPAAPTLTTAVSSNYNGADISCNGACDGALTATVSGGNGSITYLWDATANNQTTSIATGLCTGNYSVTISDASNCSVSSSISAVCV